MPVVKTELKTYRVDKFCEKCNIGLLRAVGGVTFAKPTFEHVCSNDECDNVVELGERFPRMVHEDIVPEHPVKKIVPFTLEKHKHYLTSKQMKVFIWEVDEEKGIYIDTNNRHYLCDGTNIDHDTKTASVFQPDHIVTSFI